MHSQVFFLMKRRISSIQKYWSLVKEKWESIFPEGTARGWIGEVLIAFIVIKFLVYPALGLIFGTTYPIVAVVSGSMEHDGNFDNWWGFQEHLYSPLEISKEKFQTFPFKNGFNTGDIMILWGKDPNKIKQGDILVFWGDRSDPIIHRVVNVWQEDGKIYTYTKGDHNQGSHPYETKIPVERMVGYDKYEKASVAVLRIPYLGYVKILFVKILVFISHIFRG